MNPNKVNRNQLEKLTDLPNIGESIAADLRLIGIQSAIDLKGRDAFAMYESLCEITNTRHDPCVIDVFISITRFTDGEPPLPWWKYTDERKSILAALRKP